MTSSRAKNIAENFEGLDELVVFDKKSGVAGFFRRLRVLLLLMQKRFDLAIVLKNTAMPYVLGIPVIWKTGGHPDKEEDLRHPVDRYLEFLNVHGVSAPGAVFGFSLGKDEEDFCAKFMAERKIRPGDKVIGIFPIAAWSVKNWPVDKWNELAKHLKNLYGAKIIAFGKNNFDPYNKMVAENLSADIVWALTPTLKQAIALIKRCDIFIGPDSSLIHLASCVGSNIIALYGPTSADYIFPYFHRDRVIRSGIELDCMPCYPGDNFCACKTKYGTTACMEGIGVEDVILLVEKIMPGFTQNQR